MKNMSQHTEWLSMIEISGPFLAVSVLEKVFPQGLESLETYRKKRIRSAYEEWRDAIEEDDPQLPELHRAWIGLVLEELLEYEDSVLEAASDEFTYKSPVGDGQCKPDFVLKGDGGSAPMLFVSIMPEGTDLEKVKVGDGWPVPVFERMTLLCRDKGVRLGLVTNGERWMLVNAPVGSTSSHVSWYARLWFQEPVTLKAFQSLLGVRRWFGPEEETLPVMLEDSLQHHEEVTDTLGEQVKRAVEVLVQCLDKADQDRNRELLHDVPPAELYEAGLTVMMRLVFVLCAEERGLMLLGDQVYDQFYAIVTLRDQLDEERVQHGDEILERRHDAWTRLLAVFRAVYGGIEHESLRMPALGGSLFDPDRFPFLEGRAKGTHWQETPAQPLPIDNRTVLLLLEALQVLEQRGGALLLSYKALDVEQIGHVYEGLLEHTVRRLKKDTLGLIGSQKARNPNIALAELESARLDGEEALVSIVEATTSRSKSAIGNALAKEVDDAIFGRIVTVCGGDMELAARLKPFAHLLRSDAWGDFIVYRAHSFAVTLGADRRETGTHYTPKSLTESIVETTLEPVAYVGPAEGKLREEWLLKSSTELLELKICDPAMGSGAFLVQVCRWLSERLVETWGKEAGQGKFITVDGVALESVGSAEPMPDSLDERLLIARRLVAEKCLYGVDLNPLAVELAKLSIWLITLAKGRPFGFLDHNLRSGDSLLGLHKLEQLTKFSLHPEKKQTISIFASNIEAAVTDALALRKQLRETPIRDIRDVQYMERLDQEARQKLEHIEHIADAMIGEALASGGNQRALDTSMDNLSTWAAAYIEGDNEIGWKIIAEARKSLSIDLPVGKPPRKPFHWALEFPEVFERGGFDGVVGNPPFLGGRRLRGTTGTSYLFFLTTILCPNSSANADLCAFFLRRTSELIAANRTIGFISTNSIGQGDTRSVGLGYLEGKGFSFYRAISTFEWPGSAGVSTALVWVFKGDWRNVRNLNNQNSHYISSYLLDEQINEAPYALAENFNRAFQGSNILGNGFVLSEDEASDFLKKDLKYQHVIQKFLKGDAFNSSPQQQPTSYIINFRDWPLNNETALDDYDGPVASDFPLCLERITQLVKPQRDMAKRKPYRVRWWQYAEKCGSLYEAVEILDRVIFHTSPSKHICFGFTDSGVVYSGPHTVIASNDIAELALLQSSIHLEWAWKYCSTMRNSGIRYNPSDYRAFPRISIDLHRNIPGIAQSYFSLRASIMGYQNFGLTTLYNLFHSIEEKSREIAELRNIHIEMDQAIVAAYGWNDIYLGHGFHENKQGIRFTICEEARREVLQRLLKLNHERYQEEVAQGLHNKKKMKTSTPCKKKTTPAKDDGNMDLFNFMNASSKGLK
jgi:hypothetical protein